MIRHQQLLHVILVGEIREKKSKMPTEKSSNGHEAPEYWEKGNVYSDKFNEGDSNESGEEDNKCRFMFLPPPITQKDNDKGFGDENENFFKTSFLLMPDWD